jgi:hypothetical protein
VISFKPTTRRISQFLSQPVLDLEREAIERWTISPPSERFIEPAVFLPGQLEKIVRTEFAPLDAVVSALRGGVKFLDGETLGYRVKHVDLVDGVLYGSEAIRRLRPRRHRWPLYRVPVAVASGALYESWIGAMWFGSWLMEDCLSYQLAQEHGQPVASMLHTAPSAHFEQYEQLLQMRPTRLQAVHFEELIFFRDESNNLGKRQRANQMRDRLVSQAPHASHPGVFLLRGTSGDKRILLNEAQIAEGLMSRRGFKVLDPMKATVAEIVEACAGARVVAGVEGSHLVHGLISMPPDAALFVIQPPQRVLSVLKHATDRQGQRFSFVVASGGKDEFSVRMDEVERTLDLLRQ